MQRLLRSLLVLSIFSTILFSTANTRAQDYSLKITFASFAVARDSYREIIPMFQAYWKEKTGQDVEFEESYAASGAQARAIAAGLEADIAALQQETEIKVISDADLISHDWKDNEHKGIMTTTIVAFLVRPDNPKEIKDWADLVKDGVQVLVPNPATSGGARWNVLGAFGAAKRGFIPGYEKSEEGAVQYLTDLINHVEVLAKDGRENVLNFETGIGDVAITYENEIVTAINAGTQAEGVYPSSTILIEQPIALIDTYVEKHGNREVVEGFLEYLWSEEAQRVFVKYGFRPVNKVVAEDEEVIKLFAEVEDLFTIEEFGGWPEAVKTYFGDEGKITKLITDIKGQ